MNEKINELLGGSFGIATSAIGYLILGAILFMIIGIVLVIILGRKNVFKRKNKVWNVFTKLYYLYIPVIFAVFGGIFGSLYGLNKSINKNIEKQSVALMESVVPELPEFQNYVNEHLDSIEIAGFSTSDLVDQFFDNDSVTEENQGFFSSVGNKAGKWVLQGTVDGIINYTARELDIDVSTTDGTVKAIRSIDFNHLDKSLAIIGSKSINKQVDKLFNSLIISQLLNLLIFLAVPVLEIVIYFGFVAGKAKVKLETE